MSSKRPICILQHDTKDCGAAALAAVAWYHGLKMPISTIRHYAATNRTGTTVLGLVHAAEKLGFMAKGVRAEWDVLPKLPLPAIAYISLPRGGHHFVVVYALHKKYVLVADPARGMVKMPIAEFRAAWSGVLLLLAPDEHFEAGDKRESHLARFLRLLKPHKRLIAEGIVATLAMTLLGLASALFMEHLVDDVFQNGNAKLLNVMVIGMALITVFNLFLGWVRQELMLHAAQRLDSTLILGYYRHILRLPQEFFDTRRVGEILSRVNDAAKIRMMISSVPLSLAVDTLMLVLASVMMFLYSWQLAVFALAFVPLWGGVAALLLAPIRKTHRAMMEENAELESHLVSSVTGISTVRSFGAQEAHNLRAEQGFVRLLNLSRDAARQSMISQTASSMISGFGTIGLLWFGSTLVLENALTVGALMSFNTLLGYVMSSSGNLVNVQHTVQDALIAADRVFEILALETEDQTHKGAFTLEREEITTAQFENITFRYAARPAILHDVSFTLPRGTMTAIVGESGSGKSTIAKLLQGFYTPSEGRILLGNDGEMVDVRDLHLSSVRGAVAAVPQDVELFHGSVIANVALGEAYPDEKRVRSICAMIGADGFIQELPERWNTILGEFGADLSGGQRQRLALARGLYRQPQLLVLDEATSALDSESEFAVQQALTHLREQGLTVLTIAHRLSTIARADQILVMDKGRIVERGTHTELLMKEGKYYALWMRQTLQMNTEQYLPQTS
ncbi:MAG: peptidase domain-containing ABC transporter [Candidatus Kapaibacterium sp.]|nr:MAG: peptidase domain-containing ABC transporter [Candidatus Kapabacteria bacterium]